MLKHNPKSKSDKPDKEEPINSELTSKYESPDEEPFEPIYYELDELLKSVTPDQLQKEFSTGPAVGREIF